MLLFGYNHVSWSKLQQSTWIKAQGKYTIVFHNTEKKF